MPHKSTMRARAVRFAAGLELAAAHRLAASTLETVVRGKLVVWLRNSQEEWEMWGEREWEGGGSKGDRMGLIVR